MKEDGSESTEPCDKAAYFASQMDQPLYAQAHLNNINFGQKKVRKNSAKEFNKSRFMTQEEMQQAQTKIWECFGKHPSLRSP